jgi:hypothetical protein
MRRPDQRLTYIAAEVLFCFAFPFLSRGISLSFGSLMPGVTAGLTGGKVELPQDFVSKRHLYPASPPNSLNLRTHIHLTMSQHIYHVYYDCDWHNGYSEDEIVAAVAEDSE